MLFVQPGMGENASSQRSPSGPGRYGEDEEIDKDLIRNEAETAMLPSVKSGRSRK